MLSKRTLLRVRGAQTDPVFQMPAARSEVNLSTPTQQFIAERHRPPMDAFVRPPGELLPAFDHFIYAGFSAEQMQLRAR
eukprot:9030079-Pyramimonas_sp.AAC.1